MPCTARLLHWSNWMERQMIHDPLPTRHPIRNYGTVVPMQNYTRGRSEHSEQHRALRNGLAGLVQPDGAADDP